MSSGELSLEVRDPRTHSSGHVEYEIVCSTLELLPGQPSSLVVRWSTYRRFSEFVTLDYALRTAFGSALEGVDLPPKQWFGTGDPEFILSRCRSLHGYLQCVQRRCHGVTKFGTHLGSPQLAKFLQWEDRVALSPLPEPVKAAFRGESVPPPGGPSTSTPPSKPGDALVVVADGGEGGSGGGVSAGNMAKQRRPMAQAAAARLASRSAIVSNSAGKPSAQTLAVDNTALSAYSATGSPSGGFIVGDSKATYSSSSSSLSPEAPPPAKAAGNKGSGVVYSPPPSTTTQSPKPTTTQATSPRPAPTPTPTSPPPPAAVASPRAPPPPPASIPAAVASPDPSRSSLLDGISNFSLGKLKKATTVDKSSPRV